MSLRHQDHLALGVRSPAGAHDAEDLVVGLAGGQSRRQLAVDRLGLQEQPPVACLSPLRVRAAMPFVDVVLAAADDLVEEAARLARVARDFGHAFLVAVELLEGGHRQ